MYFSHTHTQSVQTSAGSLSYSKQVTAEGETSRDVAVADAATDFQIDIAIDVSTLQSIYIVSDQDVLLEVEDATTPTPLISLKAGVPYAWHADSYFANLLTVDVTKVFVTNASGEIANIKIRVLEDPTPA